jgi:Zn-dependent M28 family amino/carboxypeptidase
VGLIGLDNLILTFGPLLFVPGLYYGATFLSWDKKIASPGAMDNLTGVGASIFMGKYFREHPERLPKNCRIIVSAMGSEEAGLKGSLAFTKKHKDDKELLINPIHINLDSISDYDHFGVISGDIWQMTNFDKNLIAIATDVYKSLGLKTQAFKNPVGGCDSTPFCKLGIPSVTLCAQNPVPTTYYHTKNDHYNRLDTRSLEKGLEGLVLITEKIQEKNGKISE